MSVRLSKEQVEAVMDAMANAYANIDPALRCDNPNGPCKACFKLDDSARRGLDKIKAMEVRDGEINAE